MSVVDPTISKLWLTRPSWTKLLPKGGPKFDRVVAQLRAVHVPRLAEDYLQLRHCVVEHFLRELTVPTALGPVSRDTEAGSSSATEGGPSPNTEAESSPVSALAEDYIVVDPYERQWRNTYFSAHDVVL